MNYQEKVALANECLVLVEKGNAEESIDQFLKSKEVKSYDMVKVKRTLFNLMIEKYQEDLTKVALSDSGVTDHPVLVEMDDQYIEGLMNKTIRDIRNRSKNEVKELHSHGIDIEKICRDVANNQFGEEDVSAEIEQLNQKTENSKKHKDKVVLYSVLMFLTFVFSRVDPDFFSSANLFGAYLLIGTRVLLLVLIIKNFKY